MLEYTQAGDGARLAMLVLHGWTLDRINGSHHIMMKDGKMVPVPFTAIATSALAW